MAKVLFMQNCFVPDENQCRRLERSLGSLNKYIRGIDRTNTYHFALGGYVADEFKERVDAAMEKLVDREDKSKQPFVEIRQYKFKSNLGKGRVCNFVVDNFTKQIDDIDYLFMFDNDIVFKETEDDIVRMLMEQMDEIDSFGPMKYPVISCNFEEHQVHNEGVLDFGKRVVHGVIKCSTGNFGCIGGGCWLIKKDHWVRVGGYTTNAIYGYDDGKFYLDTIHMKDRMVALSQDIYVIHPKDEDMEYNRFKADTNVNRVRRMNYDELTEDSKKFWEERKYLNE